jgi:predicted acetyltransferase
MLAAALPVARSLGIDPALLTCDADNIASRKVIEANGGVLEDSRHGKLRYWVPPPDRTPLCQTRVRHETYELF